MAQIELEPPIHDTMIQHAETVAERYRVRRARVGLGLADAAELDIATLVAMPTTETSKALSKDLKKRGWTFVGPTTVYAFMQAMGLVNDHVEGCCARAAVEAKRARFKRPPQRPAAAPRGSAG